VEPKPTGHSKIIWVNSLAFFGWLVALLPEARRVVCSDGAMNVIALIGAAVSLLTIVLRKWFTSKPLITLAAVTLLQACGTTPLAPSEPAGEFKVGENYRFDMAICPGGLEAKECGEGWAIVPLAEKIKLGLKSKGDMDLLTATSCHGETVKEKAGKTFELEYIPQKGIEDRTGCGVKLEAYDRDRNSKHTFGFFAMVTPADTLEAELLCNHEKPRRNTVLFCQSKTSQDPTDRLRQLIRFPVEVVVDPDKGCELGKDRGKDFEWPIAPGLCAYVFMEAGAPFRTTLLYTWGYDKYPVRKE
jgi:hypothetical protein